MGENCPYLLASNQLYYPVKEATVLVVLMRFTKS